MSVFQFHKGTIRTHAYIRLDRCDSLFQFHKGTIRTIEEFAIADPVAKFQFHKGTIRTSYHNDIQHYKVHFNSIKVRLEHSSHFVDS